MSITITAFENTGYEIDVNALINSGSNGMWLTGTTPLVHNNNLGSYTYKSIPSLIVGVTYRVTYVIDAIPLCNVQCFLGNTVGTIQNTTGTKVENLVFTGVNKRISFYSTGGVTISSYLIEELVTTITDTPLIPSNMQNNSWTLSFNPILNQWISFHSYIPNNYLTHPSKVLAKRNDTDIKLMNSGEYGQFFGEDIKPFIIETIINEYKMDTKVFDSVTVIMDTSNNDLFTNTFFDSGIIYTENQCSGVIEFNIGTNVTRKEKNWNFNNFLDITNNTSNTIFVSDWDSISSSYPIDKIVNVNKINTSKPWYQRGRMRDKYMAVRLTDANTSGTKFTIKFISSTFRASQR